MTRSKEDILKEIRNRCNYYEVISQDLEHVSEEDLEKLLKYQDVRELSQFEIEGGAAMSVFCLGLGVLIPCTNHAALRTPMLVAIAIIGMAGITFASLGIADRLTVKELDKLAEKNSIVFSPKLRQDGAELMERRA